jgi:5-methylcytosine-specific restriction protein B
MPANEDLWDYKVLMAIADRGVVGATDDELQGILQAPGGLNNIRPRRNELVHRDWIEEEGQKRRTTSGALAKVWTLTADARRTLWPQFTARDCAQSAPIVGVHRRSLTGAQRGLSDSLRGRLALLGRQARRAAGDIGVPISGQVDDEHLLLTLQPSGLRASGSELVAHLDENGLDLALRLAAPDVEDIDGDEGSRRQRLRDRLAGLPSSAVEPLDELEDWEFLIVDVDGGETEVDSAEEWLTILQTAPESSGELNLRLDPSALEAAGDAIAAPLRQLAEAVLPMIVAASSAADDPVAKIAEAMHWDEDRAQALVNLAGRSRQILLAGPPGTGKTLVARTLAAALAGDVERVWLVQFHPTYAYEDFVEGIRPRLVSAGEESEHCEKAEEGVDREDGEEGTGLAYELRPGVLLKVIKSATRAPGDSHFLVIDEINRANLPRVLGELLFALEYRGEGNEVILPYSGECITMPDNLWLIGTMNTADRSVALMDAAMRRRFKEFRLDVDLTALRRWHEQRTSVELGQEAVQRLERLNAEVIALLDEDRAIGHAFLMRADLTDVGFVTVWHEDLEPVLRDHLLGRTDDLPALEELFLGDL